MCCIRLIGCVLSFLHGVLRGCSRLSSLVILPQRLGIQTFVGCDLGITGDVPLTVRLGLGQMVKTTGEVRLCLDLIKPQALPPCLRCACCNSCTRLRSWCRIKPCTVAPSALEA